MIKKKKHITHTYTDINNRSNINTEKTQPCIVYSNVKLYIV